jgi:O-methyltransferase domain
MTERDPSEDLQHVLQLAIGYMPAVALNIVVKLGIADLIDGGPVNTKELAKKIGVMRTVKTGESAMELAAGKPVFGFFRYDPEESKVFNAAMVNLTRTFVPAVLEVYDFSKIRKIVDVGGGHGSVVAAILARYPEMQGILFDLDHVVAGAEPVLSAAGVNGRCEILAGNFFETVPAGGDAYIMKHIIHDWDDDKALTILNNIREALKNDASGKVILLEGVVAGPGEPDFAKWGDLEMMAGPGGRERTREEFEYLFKRAGFHLDRIVPTKSLLSVVEASVA